jgi:outer membrane protein
MKRFAVILFVLLVPFCFSQSAFSADQVKVAVVDMAKFQQKSIAFQKIRNELRSKLQSLQDKLDSEKASLLKLEEELQKQSMMLSLDAKESKQQELEKKRRYYKYLYDEFSIEMKGAEAEATNAVTKEINKVVDRIGKGSGYTIIFEKNMPGLVYFDDAIDITNEVIESYDSSKK